MAIPTGGITGNLLREGAVIHINAAGHFRSCSRRDQLGPFQMSDESWLTSALQNPLAVGQYVNNCSHGKLPGKFSRLAFVIVDIKYFGGDRESQIPMLEGNSAG